VTTHTNSQLWYIKNQVYGAKSLARRKWTLANGNVLSPQRRRFDRRRDYFLEEDCFRTPLHKFSVLKKGIDRDR
jgi:hypothetical protein